MCRVPVLVYPTHLSWPFGPNIAVQRASFSFAHLSSISRAESNAYISFSKSIPSFLNPHHLASEPCGEKLRHFDTEVDSGTVSYPISRLLTS